MAAESFAGCAAAEVPISIPQTTPVDHQACVHATSEVADGAHRNRATASARPAEHDMRIIYRWWL
jgi:hypothetical protein